MMKLQSISVLQMSKHWAEPYSYPVKLITKQWSVTIATVAFGNVTISCLLPATNDQANLVSEKDESMPFLRNRHRAEEISNSYNKCLRGLGQQ